MHCHTCQAELFPEAVYCWKCGASQKALVRVKTPPPPAPIESPPPRGRDKEAIVVDVVGTTHRLDPGAGLLVVYGRPNHKELLLSVERYGLESSDLIRMREYRVSGLSVIAAIAELVPSIYKLQLVGRKRGEYHQEIVKVEAGDLTEVDFR